MCVPLGSLRVADLLEGIRQPEGDLGSARHVLETYGTLTLRQLQSLVAATKAVDCQSLHELHGFSPLQCATRACNNRCNHQAEINNPTLSAGGEYTASLLVLEALHRIVNDAGGIRVTRARLKAAIRGIADIDRPAWNGYRQFRDDGTPEPPMPFAYPTEAMTNATTAAEMGAAIDRAKDPYGAEMDMIKAALDDEFVLLLGPPEPLEKKTRRYGLPVTAA